MSEDYILLKHVIESKSKEAKKLLDDAKASLDKRVAAANKHKSESADKEYWRGYANATSDAARVLESTLREILDLYDLAKILRRDA